MLFRLYIAGIEIKLQDSSHCFSLQYMGELGARNGGRVPGLLNAGDIVLMADFLQDPLALMTECGQIRAALRLRFSARKSEHMSSGRGMEHETDDLIIQVT